MSLLSNTQAVVSVIRNAFIHLPGIGPQRERTLWERGILDWSQFLVVAENGYLGERPYQRAVPLVRFSFGRGNTKVRSHE